MQFKETQRYLSELVQETTEDDFPIFHEEVEAAIRSLKNGKAQGIDNILTKLIKGSGSITINMLTKICNKIWQTGQWPSTWTQSLLITLPKKSNLQRCQNYCTISLINHPSKVMLKILLNRQKTSLPRNKQASEKKGAQLNKSSTYVYYVKKYQQYQRHLYHIFTDFKKAFDKVRHAAFLVNGAIGEWF